MAVNLTPISEILAGVVSFLPNLIDLVVGLIPVTIAIGVATFITGLFVAILAKV